MTPSEHGGCFGFDTPVTAVVIGARGGVGAAIVQLIETRLPGSTIFATSRDETWVSEGSDATSTERVELDPTDDAQMKAWGERLRQDQVAPQLVINATGFLHSDTVQPERSHRELNLASMQEVFAVNTFAPALLIRELVPLMPRRERSIFATLSARVGSIGDNRLGGWYSYRASKAAQNMMLRCASLEAKRTHKKLVCVSIHPGTVRTQLSAPFTRRRTGRILDPSESAHHIERVVSPMTPEDSGKFIGWDGLEIEW